MPGNRQAASGIALAALLALGACASTNPGSAPVAEASRSESSQLAGDRAHRQVLDQKGGAYPDPALTAYVNGIGQRLAAATEQARERWTFTVLDSPEINAFALPGGYVYVTRGLLALASDEAQLAGVIGHEIAHVTLDHRGDRETRAGIAQAGLTGLNILLGVGLAVVGLDPNLARIGTELGGVAASGLIADYSRGDELEADNLGIRYMTLAGYDPFAQAELIEGLSSSAALDARIAGRGYDTNNVPFLASHPADGPRLRDAIRTAQSTGATAGAGRRNQDAYLAAISGMPYGDRSAQGGMVGDRFIHPELGFSYRPPKGFAVQNAATIVRARGPNGAAFNLQASSGVSGPLDRFIAREWAPSIAKEFRTGQLSALGNTTINGLPAAVGRLPVEVNGTRFDGLLVAVRMGPLVYRMSGLAPAGSGLMPALEAAAESFRKTTAAENRSVPTRRIEVQTVKPGETLEMYARRMNVPEEPLQRFRILNGLAPGTPLTPGQKVKVVR